LHGPEDASDLAPKVRYLPGNRALVTQAEKMRVDGLRGNSRQKSTLKKFRRFWKRPSRTNLRWPGEQGRHEEVSSQAWSNMSTSLSVYAIVLNYNGAQITLNCVDSVLKIDYPNFRVIVVGDASTAALTQRRGRIWTRSLLC
jgi:hypothetical protein